VLKLKHSCKGFKTSNDVRISTCHFCKYIMFLAHFKNKNMFPEFLWKMPGEDDLGTEIALLHWREKKETIFLLSLHFVSLCYAIKEICSVLFQPWTWRCSKRKLKEINLWCLEKNKLHINQKFKESDLNPWLVCRKCFSFVFLIMSFGFHIKNDCTMIALLLLLVQ